MEPDLSARVAGRYEILGKMGEGGMGSIYRVRHRLLDVIRVAKVLQPQFVGREQWQKRFLREAKIASSLKHRSLAQLHDFDLDPSRGAWMIMELIDGCDLRNVLRHHGPPSVDLSLEVARQSLAAFDYLHSKSLVHRDVSPDNLMLTRGPRGEPEVKLIDLGIAKRLGEGALTAMTRDFVGKYRYSSPEQLDASSKVDHRSDLYSLGLVLYELLTGVYPFRGETPQELASAHWFQEPRSFDDSDPDGRIPAGVREALLLAMSKKVDERFESAADFESALRQAAPGAATTTGEALTAETDSILEATARAMPERGDQSDGSTQYHLDRVFDSEPRTEAVTRSPQEKAQEISRLLAQAKAQMLVGEHESALAKLGVALELDPSHEEARANWDRVEARIQRQTQIDAFAASIENDLTAGKLTQAGRLLDQAEAELGEVEALARLRLDLEAHLAARAAELESLTAKARRERDAGDLEASLATLGRALELDRSHGHARSLESELRLELTRRVKLGEIVEHLDEKLAAADFGAVDKLLRAARREYTEEPRLADFARRADQARDDAARSRVVTARERIAAGKWREAADELRAALELSPEYDEALELAMHVRGETRKATGLRDAVGTIETLLGADKLNDARARLQQATAELGWTEALSDLDQRLQEGLTRRHKRVDDLLSEADRLSQDGELSDALTVSRQALSLDPSSSGAIAMVGDLESSVERRGAIGEAARSIQRLLERGDLERAERSLAGAEELHGESAELAELRARLQRDSILERESRLERRVAEATAHLENGRPKEALGLVQQVIAADPARVEARHLLTRVEIAVEEGRAERRRLEALDQGFGEARLDRPARDPQPRKRRGAGLWIALVAIALLAGGAYFGWKTYWWSGALEITPVAEAGDRDLTLRVNGAESALEPPVSLPLQGLVGRTLALELTEAGDVVAATSLELGPEMAADWSPRISSRRSISSRPPGARVILDGETLTEPTPTVVEVDPDPDLEHTIRLELEGHQPSERTLRLAEWSKDLDLELAPVAQPGTLTVRAPYPVEILVAGQRLSGRSPRLDLPAGSYDVTLRARAVYYNRRLTVRIGPGATRSLTDFPPAVTVWVLSVPGNAELSIDGRSAGALPREVTLVTGSHRFEFKWPDRSFAEEVTLTPNSRQISSDASRILVE